MRISDWSSDVCSADLRVYREAGEREKARVIFERYLAANPDDSRALSEVGAYTLLDGDREVAERLFDRSFAVERDDMWATLQLAGAYLGVAPQQSGGKTGRDRPSGWSRLPVPGQPHVGGDCLCRSAER